MRKITTKHVIICGECAMKLPYSNPKAATAVVRRHREKFHKSMKGARIRYTVHPNV